MTTENKPKYHPKAVFALYLNQALHNFEKAVEDILELKNFELQIKGQKDNTLEAIKNLLDENNLPNNNFLNLERKYFRFLQKTKNEEKIEIIEIIIDKLYDLRNFYSHNYHYDTHCKFAKQIESDQSILFSYLSEKYQQAKEEIGKNYELETLTHLDYEKSKNDLIEYLDSNSQKYRLKIEGTFDEKLRVLFDQKIKGKDDSEIAYKRLTLLKEKISNYVNFRLFFDAGNEWQFEKKSIVLLASFFLSKKQINLFISKLRGFKKTDSNNNTDTIAYKATRDLFSYFHLKDVKSTFVSENPNIAYFLDTVSHLTKTPPIVLNNIESGSLQFTFTQKTYDRLYEQTIPTEDKKLTKQQEKLAKERKERIEKLKVLIGTEFINQAELFTEIEKHIGKPDSNKYREIIVNEILPEKQNTRTSSNRFTYFALRFIDDFNYLPNIKFKVYLDYNSYKTEVPAYHGKTFAEKTKIKRNTDYLKGKNYNYVIIKNNIFFKIEDTDLHGAISIHELRNLVFALIEEKEVEAKIIETLESYSTLFKDIQSEKNRQEIKQGLASIYKINENQLPKYLTEWLHQKEYTEEDYKQDLLKRVEFIKTENLRIKSNIKRMRKYEKIREIIKFVNRFNKGLRGNRREYLDIEQHEELEMLLGSFPKTQNELKFFLEDNSINTLQSNFVDFAVSKDSLDSILYKIWTTYEKWCTKISKKLQRAVDMNFMLSIGLFVNLKPKEYSDKRISENIDKFLKNNIVLPNRFIIDNFYKDSNIIHEIAKATEGMSLNNFYDKLPDYTNNFEKYKVFGLEVNQHKILDRTLLLISKKYLGEIIKSSKIDDFGKIDIANVLKQEDIKIKVSGKTIIFNIKEFDRILQVLEDKRIPKILTQYFDKNNNEIYYLDRKKYALSGSDLSREERQEKSFKCEMTVHDLQDAFDKINCEQLKIVSLVLDIEKKILYNHIKEQNSRIPAVVIKKHLYPGYAGTLSENQEEFWDRNITEIEATIEKLLEKRLKNRIETKKLFSTYNTGKKMSEIIESKPIIDNYRNKAFHNSLPDTGKFEDGITLLENILKKLNQ